MGYVDSGVQGSIDLSAKLDFGLLCRDVFNRLRSGSPLVAFFVENPGPCAALGERSPAIFVVLARQRKMDPEVGLRMVACVRGDFREPARRYQDRTGREATLLQALKRRGVRSVGTADVVRIEDQHTIVCRIAKALCETHAMRILHSASHLGRSRPTRPGAGPCGRGQARSPRRPKRAVAVARSVC